MSQQQQQQHHVGEDEPLRRTDANEVAFQETTPARQKYSTAGHGNIHVDKPVSVSDTGYGGASGAGRDVGAVVDAERRQGSATDTVKEFAQGVKDTVTGQKQQEAAHPVVNQQAQAPAPAPREGAMDKVKDAVTGQKPGRGCRTTADYSGDWPPSATYTDGAGRPIEGPRDDPVKKEGVMSKVMDKFHLGTTKE